VAVVGEPLGMHPSASADVQVLSGPGGMCRRMISWVRTNSGRPTSTSWAAALAGSGVPGAIGPSQSVCMLPPSPSLQTLSSTRMSRFHHASGTVLCTERLSLPPGASPCDTLCAVTEHSEIRYARSGDVHIAYQVFGQGPLNLLLFFSGTASIDSLDDEPSLSRFHGRLASFSQLIRFDCRGLGLSDPLAPHGPPALEQWVEDAVAVMDAAGAPSAALFADSNATSRAILLTTTHPDRVSQLVIVNGTARLTRAPDYPFGVPRDLVDRFLEVVTDPDAVEGGFDDLALLAPSNQEDPAFRAWWIRAGRRGASPSTAAAILRMETDADVRELLPLIRVPTLVLHRRDSQAISAAHGRYLAEHIPGATYVELGGRDSLYWVGDTDVLLAEIEEFLTGARRPPEPDRVLATVLFSDIVRSTAQATAMGDRAWHDRLDAHDAMVRRQLERFGGREVKTTGDGFLATFDGPARAIRCGCAMRDGARQLGVEVRVGLHAGEVELRGQDVAGITVHTGARVAALAGAGEILVTRTITDLVAGAGIEFEDRGEQDLNDVLGKWRLFAVRV
jgi:class 3 adenylate cyclase